MRPVMLCGILAAAVLPLLVAEPRLSFLPDEPIGTLPGRTNAAFVYLWPGSMMEQLPQIEREMRDHGYRSQLCLDASACYAQYFRDDGMSVRIEAIRRDYGPEKVKEYVSAVVENGASFEKSFALWLKRLGL